MAELQPIQADAAPQGSKVCFKCNQQKPVYQFYRHPQTTDGRLGKCKECTKRDATANYQNRREFYSDYDRSRQRTPERRAKKAEYRKRHRRNNPEKNKARAALKRAVESGRVIRPIACDGCHRAIKVEGHHTDYSKPLEVLWLCFSCHRETGHGQKVTRRDFQHSVV